VRAGGSAAVGVVAEGMDVESALGVGVVAGDVPADGGGRGLGVLLKGNGTRDLGVSANDSNCIDAYVSQSSSEYVYDDSNPWPSRSRVS
jgi:hypothetical protein